MFIKQNELNDGLGTEKNVQNIRNQNWRLWTTLEARSWCWHHCLTRCNPDDASQLNADTRSASFALTCTDLDEFRSIQIQWLAGALLNKWTLRWSAYDGIGALGAGFSGRPRWLEVLSCAKELVKARQKRRGDLRQKAIVDCNQKWLFLSPF